MPVRKRAKRKTYKIRRKSTAQVMGGTGIFKSILKFAKKHKLISRGLKGLSHILPPGYRTAAKWGSKGASAMGYGKKRGKGRPRKRIARRTGRGLARAGGGRGRGGRGLRRAGGALRRAGGRKRGYGCGGARRGRKKKTFP